MTASMPYCEVACSSKSPLAKLPVAWWTVTSLWVAATMLEPAWSVYVPSLCWVWKERLPILTNGERRAVRDQNHIRSRGQGARVTGDEDVSVGVRHGVRFREADALRVQWHNTLARE